MKGTNKANVAGEMIDIAANMLFPPQQFPDRQIGTSNLDNESQRKSRDQVRDKAIALNKKYERDRWAYKTDLYVERVNLQLQQNPALHQTVSSDQNEVIATCEMELRPKKIGSGISRPMMMWPEDFFKMLERAPATVREDATENSNYGQAAGFMLRYLYHLTWLRREPSLTKGRELFLEYHRSEYGKGRPKKGEKRHISYTDSSLQMMWREFSSVAHYWAAFLTLRGDIIESTDNPLENLDFAKFSRIAAQFAEFGAFCTNKHASDWRLLFPDHLILSSTQSPSRKPKIHLNLINEEMEKEIIKLEKRKEEESAKMRAAEEAALQSKSLK